MLAATPTRRAARMGFISIQRGQATLARTLPSDPELQLVNLSSSSSEPLHFAFTKETFTAPSNGSSMSPPLPTIVLVHGGPGSHRDYRYISGAFRDIFADKLCNSPPLTLVRVDLPGFGASSILPELETPSAKNLAEGLFHGLQEIGVIDANNPEKKIVVFGHSLGGHVAMEAAAMAGTGTQFNPVIGLGLISSVNIQVHKGLGGPLGYKLIQYMGKSIEHPINLLLTRWWYENVFKFNKSTPADEIIYTQKRVCAIDFERAVGLIELYINPKDGKGISNFVAYSTDDHLIEKERSEELVDALTVADDSSNARNDVRLVYNSGGHNPQKMHAREISEKLIQWVKGLK
jgi:pimeloyl-ACP methyl ester carboxylesterase